jgi:hypothetical protein
MKKIIPLLMLLNILLMLFALLGGAVVPFAPTFGWIGVFIVSVVASIIAITLKK